MLTLDRFAIPQNAYRNNRERKKQKNTQQLGQLPQTDRASAFVSKILARALGVVEPVSSSFITSQDLVAVCHIMCRAHILLTVQEPHIPWHRDRA